MGFALRGAAVAALLVFWAMPRNQQFPQQAGCPGALTTASPGQGRRNKLRHWVFFELEYGVLGAAITSLTLNTRVHATNPFLDKVAHSLFTYGGHLSADISLLFYLQITRKQKDKLKRSMKSVVFDSGRNPRIVASPEKILTLWTESVSGGSYALV